MHALLINYTLRTYNALPTNIFLRFVAYEIKLKQGIVSIFSKVSHGKNILVILVLLLLVR